jgi:hypothetical protein
MEAFMRLTFLVSGLAALTFSLSAFGQTASQEPAGAATSPLQSVDDSQSQSAMNCRKVYVAGKVSIICPKSDPQTPNTLMLPNQISGIVKVDKSRILEDGRYAIKIPRILGFD